MNDRELRFEKVMKLVEDIEKTREEVQVGLRKLFNLPDGVLYMYVMNPEDAETLFEGTAKALGIIQSSFVSRGEVFAVRSHEWLK